MKKKDYELIASQINWVIDIKTIESNEVSVLTTLAKKLANRFEEASPKFDRQKFLAGCGIEVAEPPYATLSNEYMAKLGAPRED